MKVKVCLLLVFCFHLLNLKAQDTFKLIDITIGLPISNSSELTFGNVAARCEFQKKVTEKFKLCVGINYDNIELKPSGRLTYDRKYFGGYLGVAYQINISKNLSINPELDFGYSFIKYKLNEFNVAEQNTFGFITQFGLNFIYDLNKRYNIIFGCFNSTLMKKLDTEIDFAIPANYITTPEQFHNNILIEIGLGIKI